MTLRSAGLASLLAVVVAALTGCGPSSSPGTDGGGGTIDAGEADAALIDAAVADGAPDAASADAGPTVDFFTSFEPGDPQPTWSSTVETDSNGERLTAGLTGNPTTDILGNIMDRVVAITASARTRPARSPPASATAT